MRVRVPSPVLGRVTREVFFIPYFPSARGAASWNRPVFPFPSLRTVPFICGRRPGRFRPVRFFLLTLVEIQTMVAVLLLVLGGMLHALVVEQS